MSKAVKLILEKKNTMYFFFRGIDAPVRSIFHFFTFLLKKKIIL